jgi:Zn-dependent protease
LDSTVKCQYCGDNVVLPFKCNYCGEFFCASHRIPESHSCPEAYRARAPREAPPIDNKGWSKAPSYKYTISYTPPSSKMYGFSIKELKHLLIGSLLVLGVGLTYFLSTEPTSIQNLIILSIAFTLSFLLHEIAHKFSAQHFNLWAEFRLTLQGALITLLSIFLPFKIISPGAVMIVGSGTKVTIGKTAVSGPITNIILSVICILFATFSQNLFQIIAFINAFLAVFNLIPFGVFDGMKVFRWNKMIWIITFALAFILATYSYFSLLNFF